jgi:hypothetical protein
VTHIHNECIMHISKYDGRWYWSVFLGFRTHSGFIYPNGELAKGTTRWKWQARIAARQAAERRGRR